MNLTLFANEIIFPCLLFAFFSYFLVIAPEASPTTLKPTITNQQTKANNSLEDFFELIIDNDFLQTELDSISDRQELIDKLIVIAASHGYYLSPSDIDLAIREHTASSQDDYICLPIGCWRIS